MVDKKAIVKRIKALPETDLLVLSLWCEKGLSFRQIEAVLDLPSGSAERMFALARERVMDEKES